MVKRIVLLLTCLLPAHVPAAEPYKPQAPALRPNLEREIDQPLRYRPVDGDFVIENGGEFFNRPLYGGNTAFRVDGGDKPEFSLYLPGRGGNVRLGIHSARGTLWLHDARRIASRYRPGELHYEIADPALGPRGRVTLAAVAYAASEGLGVRVRGERLPEGAELVLAFGPGNGQRGRRDGDIGTENVPISEYFQFAPDHARGAHIDPLRHGFRVTRGKTAIAVTIGGPAQVRRGSASAWNDLPALLNETGGGEPVAVARLPLGGEAVDIAVQVASRDEAREQQVYREAGAPDDPGRGSAAPPTFAPAELARRFDEAIDHFRRLRERVRIVTPDPWLDAAMGALNVAADAVWDEPRQAIMHGAVAWRTKLPGWRGPYALDALGWHERARRNFDAWTVRQDTSPVPAEVPPADRATNLARNEPGLHTNGDLGKSHYDMNLVFIDALLRHLLWTGDLRYARAVWPVLERHLAWERRLFRREFGPERLPLYDAYAAIWASDDLYYNGGGVAHTSAYNAWHNEMAARIARLIGKDPMPYQAEADAIRRAMRQQLWMPGRGAFAEYRDHLGLQMAHPSYGLWTFYHTLDSQVPTRDEAARMAADLDRHLRPIPVRGPGVPADRPYAVLPTTDWMPYTWSINNVVMSENLHTALAYWQAGRDETAFTLAKSALLASLYMGVSPGNIGSMNYLDVYRRESQRDFADGSGVMARAIVEGLFGMRPDALDGVLTVRPGLPHEWEHAQLRHPDVRVAYRRTALRETWTVAQHGARFRRLVLDVRARHVGVASVTVDGKPVRWTREDRRLRIAVPLRTGARVDITWRGAPSPLPAAPIQQRQSCAPPPPGWLAGPAIASRHVDLSRHFNDSVTELFKPFKYLSPRSPHVTLSLPAQGAGAWAGHVNELPGIDDAGLRGAGGTLALPNGLTFATPSAGANVAFASQWDNYPRAVTIPLSGSASRAFLLMTGTTNHMQSRFENGEIVVAYADGTRQRTALRNPDNWWPIERDYFIDDYQFQSCAPLPLRVDLKTAQARVPEPGSARERIDGGAATVIEVPLEAGKALASITIRALANEVVIGVMGVTLVAELTESRLAKLELARFPNGNLSYNRPFGDHRASQNHCASRCRPARRLPVGRD